MTSESLIEKIEAERKWMPGRSYGVVWNDALDTVIAIIREHFASPELVERTAALKSSDIKATENGESVGYMESDRTAALPKQPSWNCWLNQILWAKGVVSPTSDDASADVVERVKYEIKKASDGHSHLLLPWHCEEYAKAAIAAMQQTAPVSIHSPEDVNKPTVAPASDTASEISVVDEESAVKIMTSGIAEFTHPDMTAGEAAELAYKAIRPYLRTTELDYRAMYENLLTEYHKVVTAKGEPVSVEERSDSHRKGYQHGYEDGASMAQELSKAIMAAHAKWQASYQGMGHE